VRLHVHEYGAPAGAPVVCLHGVTGHGERFRRLGEGPLAARRVVAPDLRGHGRSPWEPPWGTEFQAADAVETAGALGIERADWVGFSFGARVLAALAAGSPQRVARLVLLDPALHLPAEVCLEEAEAEREDPGFASAEEAIEERLAAGTLFHTPREMLEEEMRQHLMRGEDGRLRYRYNRPAAIAAWSDMAAPPPPPVADVPTLILLGDRSFLDVDVSRYPRADVATVPGGHSVLWDAFDQTAAAIADFLRY
jgi:lipase